MGVRRKGRRRRAAPVPAPDAPLAGRGRGRPLMRGLLRPLSSWLRRSIPAIATSVAAPPSSPDTHPRPRRQHQRGRPRARLATVSGSTTSARRDCTSRAGPCRCTPCCPPSNDHRSLTADRRPSDHLAETILTSPRPLHRRSTGGGHRRRHTSCRVGVGVAVRGASGAPGRACRPRVSNARCEFDSGRRKPRISGRPRPRPAGGASAPGTGAARRRRPREAPRGHPDPDAHATSARRRHPHQPGRGLRFRSRKISRAALRPGIPETPPPGCVPDPHR